MFHQKVTQVPESFDVNLSNKYHRLHIVNFIIYHMITKLVPEGAICPDFS